MPVETHGHDVSPGGAGGIRQTGRLRLRDYTLPVVVACVIGALAAHAQDLAGATLALAHVPFYGRLWNAIAAFGVYCWKTLLPADLAVQCQHRWPAPPRFWAEGLALCTGYGVALLWSARRSIRATERDTPTPPHASTGDRQECLSYLDGTAPADSSGCTGMDRQECLSYLAADDTEVVPPALRLGETPRPTSAPLPLCVQSTQSTKLATRLATKIEPLELPNFKTPKLFTGLAFFLIAVAHARLSTSACMPTPTASTSPPRDSRCCWPLCVPLAAVQNRRVRASRGRV